MKYKTYAGIGSRRISDTETTFIRDLSTYLSKKYIVLSGNGKGSDFHFALCAGGNSIIFSPQNYNKEQLRRYSYKAHIKTCLPEAIESVGKFHPVGNELHPYVQELMARNYHIIMGYKVIPQVDFVAFCSGERSWKVINYKDRRIRGGTGQGIRIAQHYNIPIFNIRRYLKFGFEEELEYPVEILTYLKDKGLRYE